MGSRFALLLGALVLTVGSHAGATSTTTTVVSESYVIITLPLPTITLPTITLPLLTTTTEQSSSTTEPTSTTTTVIVSDGLLPTITLSATLLPTLALPTITLSLPTTTSTLPDSLPTTTLAPVPTTTLPASPSTTSLPVVSTTSTTLVSVACNVDCDDGIECTLDACVAGACLHAPIAARCDVGACAVWACLPADGRADKRGCVALDPSNEGAPCTDDGFACTEDICTAAGCLHIPVDSRCVPADACTTAMCAPASGDATGCTAGSPLADGDACAEDGDVCTFDVCRSGTCAHEAAVAVDSCRPVQDVFRQALGLESLTQDLADDVSLAGNGRLAPLVSRLARIEEDLAAAARALAGTPDMSVTLRPLADGPSPSTIPASERARIAFTEVLRTPREVSGFLQALAQAQSRAALRRSTARPLRHRGRHLLRGTRVLKRNLATLQNTSTP